MSDPQNHNIDDQLDAITNSDEALQSALTSDDAIVQAAAKLQKKEDETVYSVQAYLTTFNGNFQLRTIDYLGFLLESKSVSSYQHLLYLFPMTLYPL